MGWVWSEKDDGSMVAPYNGFRQCLLDPTKNEPEHFFEALFSRHMYTIMAEETNRYAQHRIEQGKLFAIFIFSSNVLHYMYTKITIIHHVTVKNLLQLLLHQPQHPSHPLTLYSTYKCPDLRWHGSFLLLRLLLLRN